ncbi:MAG: DUF262 domain-containing protein [Acidobacteria bacterium]|nr:DUF262 domain-containing protein [Acidobacteriota bacterium]
MADNNLLQAKPLNLNEILANGKKYKVPTFQRDYSWREENWEELWEDIEAIGKTNQSHYMGAIVLQSSGNHTYTIIDGQQRLATLSILALAVIQRLQDLVDEKKEPEQNQERKEWVGEQYVRAKDGASLHYFSKLFLNENNDSFYQAYLVNLKKPINLHRQKESNKLLWRAFEYFYQKVKTYFGDEVSGESLVIFIRDLVAEKMLVIQILVENDVNAYTVFETLNARGLELTTTDLLKNYLLSLSSTGESDQMIAKEQWERIIQITDLDAFPKFLRYYWNSRHEFVTKERLFKALRTSVNKKDDAFELLSQLEQTAGIYAALEDPNDELWAGLKDVRRNIQELRLFNVTQCYPLLLVAYEKLPLTEFERVLRASVVISFRYNVIGGQNPKVQEGVYNKAARGIFTGAITKALQVERELKDVYPSDEEFVSAFSTKTLNAKRSRKLVRYILYSLENQLAAQAYNFEDDFGTIEHILPERPSPEWEEFFKPEEQASFVFRLGNYTLLESGKNSTDCQNRLFLDKLPIYQTSKYQMTRQIAYPEWTPSQVRSRQEQMAKWAKTVWKIQY